MSVNKSPLFNTDVRPRPPSSCDFRRKLVSECKRPRQILYPSQRPAGVFVDGDQRPRVNGPGSGFHVHSVLLAQCCPPHPIPPPHCPLFALCMRRHTEPTGSFFLRENVFVFLVFTAHLFGKTL